MKFDCRLSAKTMQLHRWHTWFAWYPVRVGSRCIWLERVWRKGFLRRDWEGGKFWTWDYTIIEQDINPNEEQPV